MNKKYFSKFYYLILVFGASLGFYSFGCDSMVDLAAGYLLTDVSVETHDLTFQAVAEDDDPPSQLVRVSCTYPVEPDIDEDCDVTITTNQTWLTVSPTTVTGADRIMVNVDSSPLEAGTYEGNIHFQCEWDAPDDEEDIAVHLTVTAPATPDTTPTTVPATTP